MKENKNRKLIIQFALIWLIGNLCFFKYTSVLFKSCFWSSLEPQTFFTKIIFPLGFSFITFRLIHYIVEVYKRNIVETSFIIFALYVLFFPTFLAGPIDRFPRFYPQAIAIKRTEIDAYNINYGLFRITKGLIKKVFIADNLARFTMPALYFPESYTRMVLICALYSSIIQIYMDFSGYTDMAIGTSRLFGYKIMENFNRPFFRENIVSFFRNWHISLYSWIRDYFFFPIFGHGTSRTRLYVGTFITIIVFCLWHRASMIFLLIGIIVGASFIIWLLFQEIKKRCNLFEKIFAPNIWFNLFLQFLRRVSFGLLIPLTLCTDIHSALHIIKYIFRG